MLLSALMHFVAGGEFQRAWTLTAVTNPIARASLQHSAYILKQIPGIKQPGEDSGQAACGCPCPCSHSVALSSGSHQDESVPAQRDGANNSPVRGCALLLLSYW